MESSKYTLRIEGVVPAELPMRRLAEYLIQFARLLGEEELVRFDDVTEGSTSLNAYALPRAEPKVRERLASLGAGTAEDDVRRAASKIDAMLRADNTSGTVTATGQTDVVIRFSGANEQLVAIPPVAESGSLQGVLLRVGGREATTARVLLRDGDKEYVCIVTHDLARALGKHLLGPVVRLHGRGRWRRDQDGNWELIDFRATDFDVLDDASLVEAARKLQAAGGFGYRDAAEAWNRLREWRND